MRLNNYRANNFDLLRLLASIFVLFDHTTDAISSGSALKYISYFKINLSSIGVSIFFIISGFLVTQSRVNNTRLQFAKKRILRIIPAFYLCAILVTFILGAYFTLLPLSDYFQHWSTYKYLFRCVFFIPIYQLPEVFGGVSVNAPVWSLTFEVLCYAILFVTPQVFIQKKNIFYLTMLLFVIIVVGYYFPYDDKLFYYFLKSAQMSFIFFVGALLFYYKELILKYKTFIFLLSFLVFILFTKINIQPSFIHYITTIFLALSVISFAYIPIFIKLKFDISYGVYLYAYPIQQILFFSFSPTYFTSLSYFLSTLVISVFIAMGSWFFIEKKFIAMKNK